jgi:tight adherence protein C
MSDVQASGPAASGPALAALVDADPAAIWLIAAALGASVAFGVAWLVLLLAPSARGGARDDSPPARLPALWRWGAILIDPLAMHLGPWLSAGSRYALGELLRRAGLDPVLGAERFMAGRAVAAGLTAALAALLGMPLGGTPLQAAIAIGALGWLLPGTWLRDRIAQRQRAVLRELPFFLDVITLAVESGLNLASALAQAADKGPPGPLRDEFERVLRDIRAGRTRADALRAMAERLAQPGVGALVASLVVAEQQGGALAPILRAQAEQRRNERFQRAEKLAMEAPVKMLLPLLLFIFPCTFAVLLFPVFARMLMEGWLK